MSGNGSENNSFRTFEFWRRAGSIYLGYKAAQARGLYLAWTGKSQEDVEREHWSPHHARAGEDMYQLCVEMKGFFLKAGQFLGARADFVPKEICERLCRLHDQVPPMPAAQVEQLIKEEFCVEHVNQLFESIDLDKPLGSASIAQVHKAKLRRPPPPLPKPLLLRLASAPGQLFSFIAGMLFPGAQAPRHVETYVVKSGDTAWSIANVHGMGLHALQQANKGVDVLRLKEGQPLLLPIDSDVSLSDTPEARRQRSITAAEKAATARDGPPGGVVAVKVQYPNSLPLMQHDLGNLRTLAAFLSKTEIQFDLASAVDELSYQIRLEFDFTREARVMDTIAESLRGIRSRVVVPTSVPGLVSQRALVMTFVDGAPMSQLADRMSGRSEAEKRIAKQMILSRTSEAYGRMILGTGLLQADGHPGNILIMRQGRIGLLDYGQSKQLTDQQRLQVARLVVSLCKGDEAEISRRLEEMGVYTSVNDAGIRSEMGYGMFDTRGRVDPFDENSPIKRAAITTFPKEMFFVLRVVQLLRGMAAGMDLEFSSAEQWLPFAEEALKKEERLTYYQPVGRFYGI